MANPDSTTPQTPSQDYSPFTRLAILTCILCIIFSVAMLVKSYTLQVVSPENLIDISLGFFAAACLPLLIAGRMQIAKGVVISKIHDHESDDQLWRSRLSQMRYSRHGYVYIIQDATITGAYKIGRTNDPTRRMSDFGVLLPFNVHIVYISQCKNSVEVETSLHRRFRGDRINGEWFRLNTGQINRAINILKLQAFENVSVGRTIWFDDEFEFEDGAQS